MRDSLHFCVDSAIAKTRAALIACLLYMDLGLNQHIFEGDAKVVVDAVNKNAKTFSIYGHLVEEIQLILQGFAT